MAKLKAAGGFLKKMLGDLIRPVKKRVGKTVGKSGDEVAGAGKKAVPSPSKKAKGLAEARRKRDELHDQLAGKTKAERKEWLRQNRPGKTPSKNGPSSVTGAYDPDADVSGAGTTFRDRANSPLGGCAEDDALDQINKQRADMGLPPKERHEVVYTEAYRINDDTRPGDYIEEPICKRNCQEVTDPKQYPDNVGSQHQRPNDPNDGPARWDDPNRTDIPGGASYN
ncbi:hypothetical protein [Flindersiella endophytica]